MSLQTAARLVGTAVGILLVYGALFLREDEEGRLQNILEEWWVSIDDLQRKYLSRVAGFVVGTAELVRRTLDRVFGDAIWSLRAVSVSALLSLSSFEFMLVFVRDILLPKALNAFPMPSQANTLEEIIQMLTHLWLLALNFLFVLAPFDHLPSIFGFRWPLFTLGVVTLIAALMPAVKPRFARTAEYLFVPMLISLALLALLPGRSRPELVKEWVGLPEILIVAVLSGILMDVAFLALIRWMFKPGTNLNSAVRIVALACIQLAVCLCLIVGPVAVAVITAGGLGLVGLGLLFSSMTNLYSTAIALAFFVVALLLAMHRLAWPLISRPLYALQRVHAFEDRKTRVAVCVTGLAVLALAWHGLDGLIRYVIGIVR